MKAESNGIQVIRPIALSDLDVLYEFSLEAKHGITSLPKDRQLLKKKIITSRQSFAKEIDSPENEIYLFVLEDLTTASVIGTSSIISKTGVDIPSYSFKIITESQTSLSVNIEKNHRLLILESTTDGPTELAGLFLQSAYRRGGLGKLLSLSRFLFMSSYPERFQEIITAEMRGVVSDSGYSPFWEHIGRHFFQMDFPTANLLRLMEENFVADLAPRYPLYIEFLPLEAQEVIGRTHEGTLPALHLLQQQGFGYDQHIDFFDAGPDLFASFSSIRCIRENMRKEVGEISQQPIDGPLYIIGNTHLDFRACIAPLKIHEGKVAISLGVSEALKIQKGDFVRYIQL